MSFHRVSLFLFSLLAVVVLASGVFSGPAIDTTPPVISLIGNAVVDVSYGSFYVDAGATAFDTIDGDITYKIIKINPVNTTNLGQYNVTYDVKDNIGNPAIQVVRIVNIVIDTTPPVISFHENIIVNATSRDNVTNVYTDPTANDSVIYDGISPTINCFPHKNSIFPIGLTPVVCTSRDAVGNEATSTFNVTVQDRAPVITINGITPLDIEFGSDYVDAGATAIDTVDGDLTANITTTGLPINTSILGQYDIVYDVSDNYGHVASSIRIVNVVDTTPPNISAPEDQKFEATGQNTTPTSVVQANATDNADPNPNITYTHHSFPVGNTTVTWTATDSSRNSATATSVVTITDTTPPNISDISDILIEATSVSGATYNVTSTDLVDGSVVVNCIPASGSLFPIGTTPVTCNATDNAGNTATSSFNIIVRDTTPSVLSFQDNIIVEATSRNGVVVNYISPTATDGIVYDGCSPSINCFPGSGSTFSIGTTTVICTAIDCSVARNIATSTFNVTVQDRAPVITINGITPLDIEFGSDYVDAGATAIDTVDGDLTSQINISGFVNISRTGYYTIIYAIADSFGNNASATRIVNVVDKTPPNATVKYSTTSPTNQDVIATINLSEEAIVTSEGGLSHTFIDNGEFTFTFVDAAGNIGSVTASVSNIDKTAPLTSTDAPVEWQNASFVVRLTASDATSTISYYNLDGSSFIEGNNILINSDGIHTIEYYSIDAAGNNESIKRVNAYFDSIAPAISISAKNFDGGEYIFNNWTNKGVNITLSCDDGLLSGCAQIYYKINTMNWVNNTVLNKSISFEDAGYYNLTYYSVDNAGNIGDYNSKIIKIASSGPEGLENGFFEFPEGSTPEDATNVTLYEDWIIVRGNSTITIRAGTVISIVNGSVNVSQLYASEVNVSEMSGFDSSDSLKAVLQWGIPGSGLVFSQPINISIYVGSGFEGETLRVIRSVSGNSGWTEDGIVSPATCVIANGLCSFQATKASYYASSVYTAPSSVSGGSSDGGGGGGGSFIVTNKINATTNDSINGVSNTTNINDSNGSFNQQSGAGITGAVIGALSGKSWVIIIVVVLVIAGIGIYVWQKRKRINSEKSQSKK